MNHIEGVNVVDCSVFDEGWVDGSVLVHRVVLTDYIAALEGVQYSHFFCDGAMIVCGHGQDMSALMQDVLGALQPVLPEQHYYAQWHIFGATIEVKQLSKRELSAAMDADIGIAELEEAMALQGTGSFAGDVCGFVRTDVYFDGWRKDISVGLKPTRGEMGIVLGAVSRESGLQHIVLCPSSHRAF